MAPSSTRDPELRVHMRKMGRILTQVAQHATENELYEPINEILHQLGRMTDSPEYEVSIHPQAMFFMKKEGDHDATTDTSSESASRVGASSEEDASSQTSESGSVEGETSEPRESQSDEEEANSETSAETVTSSSRHQESHSSTHSVQVTAEMKRHGDPSRYPDFVGRLSFRDVHRRILFIVEVKRLPYAFVYTLGPRPNMQDPQNRDLDNIFRLTRRQIAEQVQLAFARYPEEQEIRALCVVGLFFDVVIYKRHATPAFGEYSKKDPEYYHVKLKGPDHIFNQRFTGYNPVFLREWRSAATVKVKEIKQLMKDSVKGTMVADPMIKYELISDD